MVRRVLRTGAVVLLTGSAVALVAACWLHRRALPLVDGPVSVHGPSGETTIVRDRWGVPHIFAATDEDAYFGLGFAVAQDRLFQLELLRDVGQGRLAELFGAELLPVDRLFRTVDFAGIGRRLLARARPETRAAIAAYSNGINAAVTAFPGRRPVELVLLGRDFAPAQQDDFVGVLGYLVWTLQTAWDLDPLHEDLVARVGEARACELFPFDGGGSPSVFPATSRRGPSSSLRAAGFDLPPAALQLLDRLPRLSASNTFAVAPTRSVTGHALLANDPHLDIGLPTTWYQAHLVTPHMDVIGATIPGLPFVVIGHNRDIAWGLTNLMLDSGDFFVERVRPGAPDQVLFRGAWRTVATRNETLSVKGAEPVALAVRSTEHGPIVSELVRGRDQALSFRWSYAVAEQTNDLDAFHLLNHARDWVSFRAAAALMGGVAQNVSYADREGHIGLQATGAIPRRSGRREGGRFRVGWDGSEEWEGFVPFEDNPFVLDPPDGIVIAANNPTFAPPPPYYVSWQWEPVDRARRLREVLEAKARLSLDDMTALQQDLVCVSGRELAPLISAAFTTRPTGHAQVDASLAILEGWNGRMEVDSAAAALFAVFYKHVFHELLDDEMGTQLAGAYRAKANVSAVMIRALIERPACSWIDRIDTAEREDRAAILRRSFVAAVNELAARFGGEPRTWSWGRLNTLTLAHPLGAARLLAPYFNLGPHPMPGHALTVFKQESRDDFRVHMGPSLRYAFDLGDLAHGLGVIPGGQSGVRASSHYGDLFALWRNGQNHPLLTDAGEIDAAAEGRLVLVPSGAQ